MTFVLYIPQKPLIVNPKPLSPIKHWRVVQSYVVNPNLSDSTSVVKQLLTADASWKRGSASYSSLVNVTKV